MERLGRGEKNEIAGKIEISHRNGYAAVSIPSLPQLEQVKKKRGEGEGKGGGKERGKGKGGRRGIKRDC